MSGDPASARPWRVVTIVDSLLAGGGERVAVEIARALDPARFQSHVLVTRHTGPLEVQLREAGIRYTVLARSFGFSPSKLLRAHQIVREADLIQAHKYGSNMWAALLARTARVPLVALEPTFSGVRTRRRTYGYRLWIAPVASRILCPSPVVARSLEEEGVRPELVEVIPNGVDPDAAAPRAEARAELGLDPDSFVVGIVARLRAEKAHEVLLHALAALVGEGRRPVVCIVGSGPRENELRRLASELRVEDLVVWTGERRDPRRLVSAFDVGVICSDWEGLPLAALEILAAGVPLVATRVGTLPLVLREDAGLLVDVRDDRALAAAIARLMDDAELRRALGAAARARIRHQYSFEHMVSEFARVYEAILVRGPKGDGERDSRAPGFAGRQDAS